MSQYLDPQTHVWITPEEYFEKYPEPVDPAPHIDKAEGDAEIAALQAQIDQIKKQEG